jgi:polyhydroxybutyrate depolymerase
MKAKIYLPWLVVSLGWGLIAHAVVEQREWDVNGTKRTGAISLPEGSATTQPAAGWPVVFVFHGHGGSAEQIRRQFQTDTIWPEAIVVYLQGLPTAGQLTDPQGNRAGWDSNDPPEKNRDIQLYDLVLKDLIEHRRIDAKHVFSTGHSNGGGFSFAPWAYRGDTLAAVAPSSSLIGPKYWPLLKPRPAMMSSGKNDPLVKFEWQSQMMDEIKKLNHVAGEGTPWGENGLWYDSDAGTPFATIITDGGHPPPRDIGKHVVEFFKTVSKDR